MAAQLGPNVVLMGDPRVAAVEVRESGESLIDLREYEKIVISPRKSQENPSLGLIRAAVGHKLAAASAGLPDGIRLCVVEAYRPPRLQQFYFDGYRNR
jgi:D-alanyl-D-alanine dipeptidase